MNQFKVGGVLLKIRQGVFLKEVKRIAELEVEAAFGGDVGVISNEWLLRGNARVKMNQKKVTTVTQTSLANTAFLVESCAARYTQAYTS